MNRRKTTRKGFRNKRSGVKRSTKRSGTKRRNTKRNSINTIMSKRRRKTPEKAQQQPPKMFLERVAIPGHGFSYL